MNDTLDTLILRGDYRAKRVATLSAFLSVGTFRVRSMHIPRFFVPVPASILIIILNPYKPTVN